MNLSCTTYQVKQVLQRNLANLSVAKHEIPPLTIQLQLTLACKCNLASMQAWRSRFAVLPRSYAFTNARWLSASSSRWQQSVQVAVSEDGRKLKLQCEGEQERRFHSIWLRHNCRCPVCTSVHTGQTIVHYSNLTKDLRLASADVKGSPTVIEWRCNRSANALPAIKIAWYRVVVHIGIRSR